MPEIITVENGEAFYFATIILPAKPETITGKALIFETKTEALAEIIGEKIRLFEKIKLNI